MLTAFCGPSAFVACSRAISSRSFDLPPHSSSGPPGKPPVQRVDIDFGNEDPVKQIDKAGKISGAAAEEGNRVALIRDQGFDFVDIPNMVLMHKAIQRFTSLRITLIRQLPVTIDGVVTAPSQFFTHRGFARARPSRPAKLTERAESCRRAGLRRADMTARDPCIRNPSPKRSFADLPGCSKTRRFRAGHCARTLGLSDTPPHRCRAGEPDRIEQVDQRSVGMWVDLVKPAILVARQKPADAVVDRGQIRNWQAE
ncbi:hypothetical protein QFZ27_003978 [Inquilinus ginsengisoli]